MNVRTQLQGFSSLKDGWDSYGGKEIRQEAIATALHFVDRLGDKCHAVPCSDGGVQLNMEFFGCDVEIVISPK